MGTPGPETRSVLIIEPADAAQIMPGAVECVSSRPVQFPLLPRPVLRTHSGIKVTGLGDEAWV